MIGLSPGAVLGIFIWVGQSKAKQIFGRPTEVIMGMTRAVWVGQERVWVGHGLPGLIARTASVYLPLHMPISSTMPNCIWLSDTFATIDSNVTSYSHILRDHILSCLNSFPRWRQLYENSFLVDSKLLVKVYQLSGFVHHTINIKWQSTSYNHTYDMIRDGTFKCAQKLMEIQLNLACHPWASTCYRQHTYHQIWSLYLHSLWRYERWYKMSKMEWFAVVRVTQGHLK